MNLNKKYEKNSQSIARLEGKITVPVEPLVGVGLGVFAVDLTTASQCIDLPYVLDLELGASLIGGLIQDLSFVISTKVRMVIYYS